MVVENVNIYDLIPSQIVDMIEKLNSALEIIKYRKKTISKVALFEKDKIDCPYCNSINIVKNGHTKASVQTYKCKECSKRFNDLTNTVFSGTHLNYEQIEIFIQCFKDKVSLRKTAKRMDVNKNTVHLLRLKVINALKENRQNIQLSGEIEADEIYRTINLKGTKPKNMPRISKPRTSNGTSTRGISRHKVCIASAIDENDNMFFEIIGTGPITTEMVKKALIPKIKNAIKVITDCKSSYESEAEINNWNLVQIKSNGHTDDKGNSLSNLNSLHSGLSTFLAPFRGVSTKHLQGYLDWSILKNTILLSTNLSSSNMYDNHSCIDFEAVYSDYNYIPSRTI